jgi:hypothetical protein
MRNRWWEIQLCPPQLAGYAAAMLFAAHHAAAHPSVDWSVV